MNHGPSSLESFRIDNGLGGAVVQYIYPPADEHLRSRTR